MKRLTASYIAARLIWQRGEPIDTALWAALAAEGYDVSALQSLYLN